MSNSDQLTRDWYKIKEDMAALQKQEKELRAAVIEAKFGEVKTTGTKKVPLNDKVDLVFAQSAKIGIDEDQFERMKGYLEGKGYIGPDKLIRAKHTVSLAAYKTLPDAEKVHLAELFTHGMNAPTLKVDIKKD